MIERNRVYNMDCMKGMAEMPDNYIDLAIVDVPYFDGPQAKVYYRKTVSSTGVKRLSKNSKHWEKVDLEYFTGLRRIAKNYIFWGCNYYHFPFHSGRIVWDKVNPGSDFSDCEIAATTLFDHTRQFRYMWNGMFQGKSISEGWIQQGNKQKNEKRIHPTQKPVHLYKWLLHNYAKQGDLILDTHVGSGSSIIACIDLGYDYIGYETDADYYKDMQERIYQFTRQTALGGM